MGDAEVERSVPSYMITQAHPCAGGAYGSSPLPTGPHTEGTCTPKQVSTVDAGQVGTWMEKMDHQVVLGRSAVAYKAARWNDPIGQVFFPTGGRAAR
jgi:hypothetical protein